MFAARLGLRSAARAARPTPSRLSGLRSKPQLSQQHRTIFNRPRYRRFGEEEGQQYSNFGPIYRAQYIWRNYQPIILVAGAGGGTFYFLNLEEVPVTHRRRFNIISPATEKKIMSGGYEEILQEFQGKILPSNHPYTQMVARVVERLLPSAGALTDDEWRVHVIDDPNQKNAFVMPGGKVFVFSGILPICRDEDGLAAVLGHEIAHNVAHHAAERLSRSGFVLVAAILTSYVFDVSGRFSQSIVDMFLSLPNSRTQEAEADHIGLLIMAQSCYDPEAAVGLWQRMAEAEKYAPPQFMSTHPSSYNRMDTIRGWLPEAKAKFEESGCSVTSGYARKFKEAFQSPIARRQLTAHPPPRSADDDYFF